MARNTDRPGNRARASTSAIGTPTMTHTAVLALAVLRLRISAAREDSEVTSGRKFDQSMRSRIATSGVSTNSAPAVAGKYTQTGSPTETRPPSCRRPVMEWRIPLPRAPRAPAVR